MTRIGKFLNLAAGRVAAKVSVHRLIYPRDFNFFPAVREAILTDLQRMDN